MDPKNDSYAFEIQLLMLSASANKLAKLKEQAEEYASLIMEELDPENFGYIEVKKTSRYNIFLLFKHNTNYFFLLTFCVVSVMATRDTLTSERCIHELQ